MATPSGAPGGCKATLSGALGGCRATLSGLPWLPSKRQRPDEAVVRILVVRLAAVPRYSLGAQLQPVIRQHPPGAERAAGLLVGLGEQDHVAREGTRSGFSLRNAMRCATPCPFMSSDPLPHSSLP